MIIKIKEMRNEVNVNGAAVTIPMEAVESVNARFVNTLYGHFNGDRLAFPLVENYVKNTWAKYGLKRIQLHEEFFLFPFNTKEGMESVMENDPWLICRVPLLLNEWIANTILKKDEIKSVLIGKPLMLDSYTSNMCLNSWGRSAYARVLIEIAVDVELMKSLVIAIPVGYKEEHTFATIDIEYEWTPPRCASCCIFDHVSEKCPKLPKVALSEQVIDDGFIEVKKKTAKPKKKSKKQVEGIRLNKPPLNLQYRRVDKGKSSKVSNEVASKESTNKGPTQVTTNNSFSALSGEADTNLKDDDHVNAGYQTPVEGQALLLKCFLMINVGAWNIRGMNLSPKQNEVRHVIYDNKLSMCAILESYVATRNLERLCLGACLGILMHLFSWRILLWDHQLFIPRYNQKPKGKDGILRKLDRVLVNLEFLDVFMGAHAVFKPYRISDHSPAVLSIPSLMKVKPMPFRIFNVIILDDRFKDVVRNAWMAQISGFYMFRVVKKLKCLKKPILKLMYDKGNLNANVVRLREELDKVQTDLDSDPSNLSLREKEAATVADFDEALLMEEKFLKQKAKITWLKEGDYNTAYFHKVVKSRVSRSRIDVVTDAYGNVHHSTEVAKAFINHYEIFLGQPGNTSDFNTDNLFPTTLNESEALNMVRDISSQEVKSAMFSMGNDNSPGPDGFMAAFFKDTYDIIGVDVIKAVKEFFTNGILLKELNHTIIALIPKVNTPARVTDCRPISCCNVLFKCISKIIANHLKDSLKRLGKRGLRQAKVIKDALDDFKDASGLNPSMPKSKAYFCNVINYTKLAILNVLPFEEDRLPVKYLGVPLVSSRLISRDCKELIDKVQNRVNDWKNKSLSIAGRLQLIQSVLSSLHVGKVKVAWDVVCLSKQEGGLGIRRLDHFNKALMVSHVWKLLSFKESLWVKWIHVYKLKNRSFLYIPYRGKMSWSWRKLLLLRPLIREFIWSCLGDGRSTSMWFDKWCVAGPSSNIISLRDITRASFNHASKVRDCIQDGLRIWPNDWLVKYPILNSIPILVISDDNSDSLEWRCRDGMGKPFSVHNVWDSIRHRDNLVSWCDLVWFHACISRHVFNIWLIFKQRLRTQDCLRSWEVDTDLAVIAGLTGVGPSLASIITHLMPIAKRKSSKSCIGKLVVAVVAYFIWHERNSRLFNKVKRSVTEVVDCILSNV
nr:hypothetical protein [Tanacetum cinerariifolium]